MVPYLDISVLNWPLCGLYIGPSTLKIYFCVWKFCSQVGLLLEALGRGGEEEQGKRGMGGKLFHLRRKTKVTLNGMMECYGTAKVGME